MSRLAVQISYRGTHYFGWQRQPNAYSVQECIEENLAKIFGNQKVSILGCGRTDTGVHAMDYFFHFDLPEEESPLSLDQLHFKLNKMLPKDIVVHSIRRVPSCWHARFDASQRTYRYYVRTKKNAFEHEFCWYVINSFDLAAMNEAAQFLLGQHDFTSFSKLHTDVKTNLCHVHHAEWVHEKEDLYYFEITADRFLRNMVRATVGTLMDVGLGKLAPSDLPKILQAKDRGVASQSVPACGLFLWEIKYEGF